MYLLYEEGKVQRSWLIIQDGQLIVDPDFMLLSSFPATDSIILLDQ